MALLCFVSFYANEFPLHAATVACGAGLFVLGLVCLIV